jgi:hypothetical protein
MAHEQIVFNVLDLTKKWVENKVEYPKMNKDKVLLLGQMYVVKHEPNMLSRLQKLNIPLIVYSTEAPPTTEGLALIEVA